MPQRRFNSENVTISLNVSQSTANLNISNIQTFTVWCELASVFFTRLDLPTDINISPVVSNVDCKGINTSKLSSLFRHLNSVTQLSLIGSFPVFLGMLTPLQHQTSGRLYAIDEKTFFIQNFNYDGLGPGECD